MPGALVARQLGCVCVHQVHVFGSKPGSQLLEQLVRRADAPVLAQRDVAGCDAILVVHQHGTAAVAVRAEWRQQLRKPPGICLAIHFDPQARRYETARTDPIALVVRPPRKQYTFEDVHFDFDRYSLRPEATRVLDEAVARLEGLFGRKPG